MGGLAAMGSEFGTWYPLFAAGEYGAQSETRPSATTPNAWLSEPPIEVCLARTSVAARYARSPHDPRHSIAVLGRSGAGKRFGGKARVALPESGTTGAEPAMMNAIAQ